MTAALRRELSAIDCPPEDCGGAGGYANFLAAIRDPDHGEHDEYLDWIGGEFDPEEFELDEFDARLKHIDEIFSEANERSV